MKTKEDFLNKSVMWMTFADRNPHTAKIIIQAMEDYAKHVLDTYSKVMIEAKTSDTILSISKITAVNGIFANVFPFLSKDEYRELNCIQKCGIDKDGCRTNVQAFLNTLNHGTFLLLEELIAGNIRTYTLIQSKACM